MWNAVHAPERRCLQKCQRSQTIHIFDMNGKGVDVRGRVLRNWPSSQIVTLTDLTDFQTMNCRSPIHLWISSLQTSWCLGLYTIGLMLEKICWQIWELLAALSLIATFHSYLLKNSCSDYRKKYPNNRPKKKTRQQQHAQANTIVRCCSDTKWWNVKC